MEFAAFIERNRRAFAPIFKPGLSAHNTLRMELSSAAWGDEDVSEAEQDAAILERIERAGAIAGVGGYLEDRAIYRDTDLFQGDAERSIHIGVDVFMPAGSALYVPLAGEVHSYANRQVYGDYGPVVILRHRLDGVVFHTLYGHLSEASLKDLHDDKPVEAGDRLGEIGARPRNGNWAPHLHFQLVLDMQDYRGDYPGVVRPGEVEFYRANCPDPSALLLAG